MKSGIKIKGKITATVLGPDGKVKRWSLRRRVWNALRYFDFNPFMVCVHHNIVTDQGDALIADIMSNTPARTKVDNTNGYIEVGTAYSASGAKAQTGCHTPTGSREAMDATYPKQKGAFGAANDNVTQYRATFEAGDLNATITEASIHNASTSGDCLAYGQITPSAVVSSADALQIDWEITFLGA